MWHPLWLAFTVSSVAGICLMAGAVGFRLSRRDRFFAGSAWVDGPIWWQIAVGLALIPIAVLLWRAGLRSIDAGNAPSQVHRTKPSTQRP